ncbi:MAG TPA: flagellar basal body-associated FliL family protein, partial [Porticoccaceae bacterium]
MTDSKPKSQVLKWLLVILFTALLAVLGAILYLLLDARNAQPGETSARASQPVVAPDPIFVKINPMTINLSGDGYGQRLLYVGLTLRVGDEQTRALLDRYMPELQSRLLVLLSGQNADELITPAGKEQLATRILELFDTPFVEPQPPLNVQTVLF